MGWIKTMEPSAQVVLVIEDNPANMKLFHDLLLSRGYAVLEAVDGIAGFRMAQEHHPNLILLDIQLPGLNGLDLIQRLKEDAELQSIPVIAVTACAMKGDEEACLRGGFNAYISKPISVSHFLETVEGFLKLRDNVSGHRMSA